MRATWDLELHYIGPSGLRGGGRFYVDCASFDLGKVRFGADGVSGKPLSSAAR